MVDIPMENLVNIPENHQEDTAVYQEDIPAIHGMKIVFLQSVRKISAGAPFPNNICDIKMI